MRGDRRRIGDVAPLFTAVLHTGERFSLIDHRERNSVVLFFYPRDFTSGCTREACTLRDNLEQFTDVHAVVVGISYDSNESHARFAGEMGLAFPLIADSDRSISRAYGAERFFGRSLGPKRMTVVIDTEGVIRKIDRGELTPRKIVTRALTFLSPPDVIRDE